MNNMCEQLLAIKRIEAVIESRNRLIELQEGLVYVSETDSHKKLTKAYEKFEQSYVDMIIAEAKYLESLKEKPIDITESDSEKIKKMVDDYWKK
jgi:hypothetical protein